MGLGFFDIYPQWIDEIKSIYHVPESKNFQKRNFEKVSFHNTQIKRFFTIIKILAKNGPCTAREIARLDTAKNQDALSDKKENDFYILLNGRKNQVISLQERKIVVSSKSVSKDGREKKFALSYFGIFYAIKLFFGSNVYDYVYPPFKKNHDFSEQKNSQTIIDVLAKNYTWALPLIFGKWKYLKNNKYINAHHLARLAIEKYFISELPLDVFDDLNNDEPIHNLDHPFTDNYFNDEITARFYFEQERLWNLPVTKNISELINDKEINNFLEKTLTKYQIYLDDHKTKLKNYQYQLRKTRLSY